MVLEEKESTITSVSETEEYGEFDEEMSEEFLDYELSEEENEGLCRAFTLLDVDGDGVIELPDLVNLLISLGRLPFDEELEEIKFYSNGVGCEGTTGMDYKGFKQYFTKQFVGTTNEDELRKAFEVFDSSPPTGKINLTELRHYLKHKQLKLTDDEIDFLFREEDYWMLEEKSMFEYDELINKIMGNPCQSKFLHC